MKKNILLAIALTALFSCSSDDFVGGQEAKNAESANGAIVFNMSTPTVTRETKEDQQAATALGNRFIVWGEKINGL